MPVQKFPFVTDGIHGDVPINFYPASDSERGVVLYGTPGLSTLCTLTNCTQVRGLYPWGNYIYAVAQRGSYSVLWRVSSAGTAVELGTITTSATGPVWMERNQSQLCIVDGVTGYTYLPSTGIFSQISDLNFPGASSMAYQDGYGLFTQPNSNEWFFSALFDFRTFDALDFYAKESRPDNVVGILSFLREPYILGETATEVWYNAGGDNSSASNPTFARNAGGLVEYGCTAPGTANALQGMSAVWLTDKGQVVQVAGYRGTVISNQMFDRAVASFPNFDDASAFSYRDSGHVFYQINFPSGDQSWVFDAVTGLWHKRQSYKADGSGWGRHRANCYARLGSKHYVGDFENGKVYEMSLGYYSDAGEEIQRVLYSQNMEGGLNRVSFPSVQVIVEGGHGLISGTDPQVMLQFSGDNGFTWSWEQWRSAGKIGEYDRRAVWHQQGSGYRRMYKLTFSDPVLWRILGVDFGIK